MLALNMTTRRGKIGQQEEEEEKTFHWRKKRGELHNNIALRTKYGKVVLKAADKS